MPHFTLIPSEHDFEPEEFVAEDPGQALGLIHRLGWNAADLQQDGEYLYSLALNPEGVWSITRKAA